MVIRKFLIHPFVPPAYKVALEAFEGERNFVAFDLLDAAYDHHDFDGFIHYEIRNVVAFVIRFYHFSLFLMFYDRALSAREIFVHFPQSYSGPKQAKKAVLSPPYIRTKKETAHDEREPPLAIR